MVQIDLCRNAGFFKINPPPLNPRLLREPYSFNKQGLPTWLAPLYTYHQMITKKTTLDTRDVGLDALLDLDGYIIDQD